MNEEMNRIDLWMKILGCLEGCLEIVVWIKGAWSQRILNEYDIC